jgi:hypothetical protein
MPEVWIFPCSFLINFGLPDLKIKMTLAIDSLEGNTLAAKLALHIWHKIGAKTSILSLNRRIGKSS